MFSSRHYKSPSCYGWWSQELPKRRYFVFSLSHGLTSLSGERVTSHYNWVSLIISDYLTKFGDHSLCGRGDIKLSNCPVTSLAHVVRRSCEIMGKFASSHATTMSSLITVDFPEKEIFCFNLPNALTWPRDLRVMSHHGWIYFIISHYPTKFGGYCLAEEEKFCF